MEGETKNQLTLGVDIGGTKVTAGLVNASGTILHQTRVTMPARGTAEEAFAAVETAINAIFAAQPEARGALGGIGICAPGPLDPGTGTVLNPPNLPCWRNFPLAAEVQRVFGVCAKIDNDANAAALAEAIWGVGVGFRNMFYATLGTGIGTGIIFDGRVYHGRTGSAAEGGHVSIDYNGPRCGCGKRGCIEVLCSGTAIARRARELLANAQVASQMRELAGGNLETLTTEIVAQAYRGGDVPAGQVLQQTADLLTVWLGNIVDLLEPDVIVFGGGVAQLISDFFPRMQNELHNWSVNSRCGEIPLRMAKYGPDAGIAGAAALCSGNSGRATNR